ncbi:MAG: bifunctional 5,10-methylenetetrahydrofolate dehydrogenase/5,10-methenyltetrahydrofolate cyclohydrolase [Ignavibacteria bacterium]|nr:bifunctional 5,10-methylenetetrahydrofolate dehydrogenase/5,10-methenyltetrahydrofolate cyclohydrolase [Ignavibacteria bacterium]
MPAQLIDGKLIASDIIREVTDQTRTFIGRHGFPPGLAFILVGSNPGSEIYVKMKGKACEEVGFHSVTDTYPESVDQRTIVERIRVLNADRRIHGILVQLPLPKQIDEPSVIESIDPAKDVDGFHPYNVGRLVIGLPTLRPCTPAGVQELLIRSGYDPSGKHVVVVGRSNIVGKPVANILLQKQAGANGIVTVVHTGASDLERYIATADILIASMGKAGSINGGMLKPGAVVIDVGINRVEDPSAKNGYRIVGDVDFESASEVASAITPVPGGVGPMTIAMLLRNTLQAARSIARA